MAFASSRTSAARALCPRGPLYGMPRAAAAAARMPGRDPSTYRTPSGRSRSTSVSKARTVRITW
jgi:hypothetical protein